MAPPARAPPPSAAFPASPRRVSRRAASRRARRPDARRPPHRRWHPPCLVKLRVDRQQRPIEDETMEGMSVKALVLAVGMALGVVASAGIGLAHDKIGDSP